VSKSWETREWVVAKKKTEQKNQRLGKGDVRKKIQRDRGKGRVKIAENPKPTPSEGTLTEGIKERSEWKLMKTSNK